jgi:hypothetical protein
MATWTVKIELIKSSGEPSEVTTKTLDQLAAVALYRDLAKRAIASYPETRP